MDIDNEPVSEEKLDSRCVSYKRSTSPSSFENAYDEGIQTEAIVSMEFDADQGSSSVKRPIDDDGDGSDSDRKKLLRLLSKKPGTYAASGLKSSLHGTVFQLKLSMLFLKRALGLKYRFKLATEMIAAEKFDDIVFAHDASGQGNSGKVLVRFVQAKHRIDKSRSKIKASDLLNETDGDFSLPKYFTSYRKIARHDEFSGNDVEFEDFVICSNADFEFGSSKGGFYLEENALSLAKVKDEILQIDLHKFKPNFNGKTHLVEVLRNSTDLYKLANKLVDCVVEGKSTYGNKCKDESLDNTFKLYEYALTKEVIDCQSKKLKIEFLNGDNLSRKAENLRKAIQEVIKNRKLAINLHPDPTINSEDLKGFSSEVCEFVLKFASNRSVKIERKKTIIKNNFDKLSGYVFVANGDGKIKFSNAFLRGDKLPGNLDYFRLELHANIIKRCPQFDFRNLKECVFEVYRDFKKYPELIIEDEKLSLQGMIHQEFKIGDNIGVIDNTLDSTEKIAENFAKLIAKWTGKPIKVDCGEKYIHKNLAKLSGEVLIKNYGIIQFKPEFINSTNLSENLLYLRKCLRDILESRNVPQDIIGHIKFQINNFPKYELPDDSVSSIENDIQSFLDKLVFGLGYLDEEDLGKVIEAEIGREFNKIDAKNVYCRFLEWIMNWMKEKDARFFTHSEGKEFFDAMKRQVFGSTWFGVRDPVEDFTGRTKQLEELNREVERNKGKGTVISHTTSIAGLGGVGKSELARKYIHSYSNNYHNAVWIRSDNYMSIVNSFLDLAAELGIPKKDVNDRDKGIKAVVREIYAFLSRNRSIFVFDNAENLPSLEDFWPSLPPESNPYILVTSRNQEWGDVRVIDLKIFTEEEAVLFIRRALVNSANESPQDVENLARTMHYLPLALRQAISFINEKHKEYQTLNEDYVISDYLKYYEQKKRVLLDFSCQGNENDFHRSTTFTTWEITLEHIRKKEHGEDAVKILYTMAYLSPDDISTPAFLNLPEFSDFGHLASAIQLLSQYSMINIGPPGKAYVHRLVQEVTRMKLREMSEELQNLSRSLELARFLNPDHAMSAWSYATEYEPLIRDYSDLPVQTVQKLEEKVMYKISYSFGKSSIQVLEKILESEHPNLLELKESFASVCFSIGQYDESNRIYKEVYEIRERLLKKDNKNPLSLYKTKARMSLVLSKQGKNCEALKTLDEVLMLTNVNLKENDTFLLAVQNNKATILEKDGKYHEALKSFEEVHEKQILLFGRNHRASLETEYNKAVLLDIIGKHDEGLSILKDVYDRQIKLLGEKHPKVLITMSGMARILNRQGKYNKAIEMLNTVSEIETIIFGDFHPTTLETKNNLAVILEKQGNFDKSREMYRCIYEVYKIALGECHPNTLKVQHNLGFAEYEKGNYNEALEIFKQVKKEQEIAMGESCPDILQTKNNIAMVLMELGHFDEAMETYKEICEVQISRLGLYHQEVLITKYNMACVLKSQGKIEEAKAFYEQIYNQQVIQFGHEHPDALNTKNNKGLLLYEYKQYEEALKILIEVHDSRERIMDKNHPDLLISKNNIATVLIGLQKYSEAYDMLKLVYNLQRNALGELHPDVLLTKNNMAAALFYQGKYSDAEKEYAEIYEAQKHKIGASNPKTLITMCNFAMAKINQGKYEDGLQTLKNIYEIQKSLLGEQHPDTEQTDRDIQKCLELMVNITLT